MVVLTEKETLEDEYMVYMFHFEHNEFELLLKYLRENIKNAVGHTNISVAHNACKYFSESEI